MDSYFLPVSFSSLILPQEPTCLEPFHFNSIGCKLIFWGTKSIPERYLYDFHIAFIFIFRFKKENKVNEVDVIISSFYIIF